MLDGKPLPPRRAFEIARDILRALDGNSSTDPDVTRGVAAIGEPAYAAPEAGTKPKDPRVLVYAAGAMLYELLVGRPPFVADDAEALKRMHTYAPLQPLAQRVVDRTFSDAVEAIVATALAKAPDRRYQSTAEMLETIEHVLPSLADAAPTAPPVAPVVELDPDDSLLQYAEELKRTRPPAPPAVVDVPPVFDNASRIVPQTPWPARIVERVPQRMRWPIVGGVGVLLLVIVIAKCSGGSDAPATSTISQPATKPDAVLAVAPGSAATPPPIDLEARCEQLGKTCGDQDKHRSKLTAACQLEAQVIVEKQCSDVALAAYDCYERDLCGKDDKVWALADLDVLSDRRGKCVSERAALIMCLAK